MHILVPSGSCRRDDSIEGFSYKGVILGKCKISFSILSTLGLGFLVCGFFFSLFIGFWFFFGGGRGIVVGFFSVSTKTRSVIRKPNPTPSFKTQQTFQV